MTTEAAFAKLCYVLSKTSDLQEQRKVGIEFAALSKYVLSKSFTFHKNTLRMSILFLKKNKPVK